MDIAKGTYTAHGMLSSQLTSKQYEMHWDGGPVVSVRRLDWSDAVGIPLTNVGSFTYQREASQVPIAAAGKPYPPPKK